MFETEQVLRKTFTHFQWDVSPGASGPYVHRELREGGYMSLILSLDEIQDK